MTVIAKYFASLSVVVDKKSVALVDTTLSRLEKKLRNFGKLGNKNLKINFSIGKVNVDQKRLNTALGNSLDLASKSVVFEVTRFAVNSRALQAALLRAMRGLPPIPPRPGPNPPPPVPPRPGPVPPRQDRSRGTRGGRFSMGLAASGYGPVMALAATGYATSRLNRANQELVSNNIAAESVLGTRSKELLDRLSERSDYFGVNYKDTLPQFTKFMASSVPLMGIDNSQSTFESFMQFGRTRGASKISMNRALTAIGQMSAKGQVMAEELKGQLGDAAGFGEVPQLFAEAYQIQTGGNLTGAKARAALMKAMQDGNVKTADVLPLVTKLMNDLSAGGIEKARNSSTAQQARAENAISGRGGLLQTFSEGGGEEGFSRMWGSFATAMKESKPAVESLTRGFNEISKYASFAMLLPQSFKRAFEGRDSWVADQLGAQNIQLIKDWYSGISDINTEIKTLLGTAVEGWRLYFQEFGDEWLALLTGIQGVLLYSLKAINAALAGEGGKASNYIAAATASATGKSREEVEAIANGVSPPMGVGEVATGVKDVLSYTPVGYVADKYTSAYSAAGEWIGDKTGISTWWDTFTGIVERDKNGGAGISDGDRASIDYQREMAMSREQFKASQTNQVNISSGAIVINANTSDPQALSDTLMSTLRQEADKMFVTRLDTTMLSFPQGE